MNRKKGVFTTSFLSLPSLMRIFTQKCQYTIEVVNISNMQAEKKIKGREETGNYVLNTERNCLKMSLLFEMCD